MGNIPGGDTFQRNLSAKNESVAVWGLIIAGALYFIIGNTPVLMGIYWKKANSYGAITSMILGGIVTFALFNATETYAMIGAAVGIISLVIVSLVTQEKCPPKYGFDIHGNKIDFGNRLGFIKPVLSLNWSAGDEDTEKVSNGLH